jgi:hypothetical protein
VQSPGKPSKSSAPLQWSEERVVEWNQPIETLNSAKWLKDGSLAEVLETVFWL